MRINLINTNLKDGYLPRINVNNDKIFLGECLVTNENNTCQVMAINCTNEEQTIEVDPKEIFPYQEYGKEFLSSDSEVETVTITNKEERINKILESLKLDHLNKEEKAQIETIIQDYPNLF